MKKKDKNSLSFLMEFNEKNKKDKQKVKVKIEGDIPFIRKAEKEEKVKKQEERIQQSETSLAFHFS